MESKKKINELYKTLGQLQTLVGNAKSAYQNDRDPDRYIHVVEPLEKAFDLCINARVDDKTVKSSSPWLNKPDKAGDWVRYCKKFKHIFGLYHITDSELQNDFPLDDLWLPITPPEKPEGWKHD